MELDTNWFNLNNYQGLSELDLFGWERQISVRSWVHFLLFSTETKKEREIALSSESMKEFLARYDDSALRWTERIKANPILEPYKYHEWHKWRESSLKYPFNTFSVMSTTAIWCWYSGRDDRFNDVWDCCELENTSDVTEEQQALIETPYNLLCKNRGINTENLTNVSIDLAATDEQIKQDFCHWLSEYRKAIGYESNKKNFSDKNLAEWVQWRLLPYLDLLFVAAIEEKTLTQPKMARLIFSDEYDVDIVDRLRRTTKPKAEWLMREET